MEPDKLSSVQLLILPEPGKGRAITKPVGCVKVVLDVTHQYCAYPLKHIESSKSGM